MNTYKKIIFTIFCCFIFLPFAFSQEDVVKIKEPKVAGEFFGIPVSMDNYLFAKSAVLVFGTRWGAQPKTPQELEDRVWEDLLLSYEAFRRNVTVEQSEVEEEVNNILASEKVSFDRKNNRKAYEDWVKERVGESAQIFENQIKHLLQLQKLREEVINSIQPTVTEAEAFQEFLNEYNTLSLELVQFDKLEDAENYYKKMKNPKMWKREAKKNPKFAQKPGFVSLEFLIDMWKIPKEDAYAMIALPEGSVYKPAPIYKGYGVFHTLKKRVADKEKFPEYKSSYLEQVKRKKQYEGFGDWLKSFKKDAQTKVYTGQETL